MSPPITLQDYDIHIEKAGTLDSISDSPELLNLFTLILSVESLEWDLFGGTMTGEHSIHATPVMQYESELKLEAEELAEDCRGSKRPDASEESWVQILQPIVFYRFNTEAEEAYKRRRHHHCFICGKHFPLRSRPLVNHRNPRTFENELRRVHGSDRDAEDEDVCRVHYNIPNFDIGKLTYLGYEDEKKKIPDLTMGLLVWADDLYHRPPNMAQDELDTILQHDLVKAFHPRILHDLETRGHIKPIFAFARGKKNTHVRRVAKPSLHFPFVLWEAKKASEGDPVLQNALKVKMILAWQQDLATRANIAWAPLVFHFVSQGSEWKLYTCHLGQSTPRNKIYSEFRLLWSGDCANRTKALQLLYLVDIIALWGQFQYKPFAAACMRTLRKERRDSCVSDGKLLQYQRAISAANFRSLQSQDTATVALPSPTFDLLRGRTFTSGAELQRQFIQGFRALSLRTYFIPERDGFIWLQHRQLYGSNLLVVRVNTEGLVLPPLIIFHTTNWDSQDFRKIIREEKARMPQNVETDFRYDENYTSVLEKCFNATKGYCTMRDLQFCAILPLERRPMESNEETVAVRDGTTLTQLLGLQELVDRIRTSYKRYCSCNGPDKGRMILCDSTRCNIGWYHFECVGLDINADRSRDDWICATCKRSSNIRISNYDNEKWEPGISEASDRRIQRARSVHRAWKDHDWPEAKEVQKLYSKICCRIEMDTNTENFSNTVECLEADRRDYTTQTRAVLREDPTIVSAESSHESEYVSR
ncbi:hypothetical protein BKA63DRAFT_552231 [Paraphoma chrysanthemicola]|nr:hypothetical protein BKA63DRAFT_552231 [Paraphoma chrysanthemicola]